MAAITTERLMFRLPRELRDKIYDLAFATEHKNATIEFATARSLAPSINLLLTGRCIHQEAEEYYQSSNAAFWSENIFILPPNLTYDSCRITATDIHHMKHIRLSTEELSRMVGSGFRSALIDLKTTDDDPLNWAVPEWQASEILHRNGDGILRWLKVTSRFTSKSHNEEQKKKHRLNEIIAALWRLAGANSQAVGNMNYPTTL